MFYFQSGCEGYGDLVIEDADEVAGMALHVLKLELFRLGRPPQQHPSRQIARMFKVKEGEIAPVYFGACYIGPHRVVFPKKEFIKTL